MITLLESHEPVRLAFLKMALENAELHPFVLDAAYRSMPSRLMVPEGEAELARHVITEIEASL